MKLRSNKTLGDVSPRRAEERHPWPDTADKSPHAGPVQPAKHEARPAEASTVQQDEQIVHHSVDLRNGRRLHLVLARNIVSHRIRLINRMEYPAEQQSHGYLPPHAPPQDFSSPFGTEYLRKRAPPCDRVRMQYLPYNTNEPLGYPNMYSSISQHAD